MESPGYGGGAMESSCKSTEGTQAAISSVEEGLWLERLNKVGLVQSLMWPSALYSAPGCSFLEAMMM